MSALGDFEAEIRQTLAADDYARAHPTVARELDTAFSLLIEAKTEDAAVSSIGDRLRDALLAAISDLLGDPPRGPDHPILRLRDYVSALGLTTRETKVLTEVVEMARVALRLDYRLSTIREELQQGQPPAKWDELRRAAFATAFACYELDRLARR